MHKFGGMTTGISGAPQVLFLVGGLPEGTYVECLMKVLFYYFTECGGRKIRKHKVMKVKNLVLGLQVIHFTLS